MQLILNFNISFLAIEKIIVATRIWIWTSSNIFFNFLAPPKDCTRLHKLDNHSKRSCDNQTIPRYSPFTKSIKKNSFFFNWVFHVALGKSSPIDCFTHEDSSYVNFLEQKKDFTYKINQSPQDFFVAIKWPPFHCLGSPIWPPFHCLGSPTWPPFTNMAALSLFRFTNMAAVSLFRFTNMAAVSLLRCSNIASVSLLSCTSMAAVSLPRCSTAPTWPPFHCLGAPMS